MPMMNEAMSRADWERVDKGLPPLKKEKVVRKDPDPPDVQKLTFKELPLDRFVRLISAERKNLKNKDGVSFVGFDVQAEFKVKEKKQKPLDKIMSEEPETYILAGWMPEGEWLQFQRTMRSRIDLSMLQM